MLIFDDKEPEIHEYTREGYEPTMHFAQWRVAIANYYDRFDENKHFKTDCGCSGGH